MRVRVDHAADAVYLNLTDRPIKDSEEVADGTILDYDEVGRIVGVESGGIQAHRRPGGAQAIQLRFADRRFVMVRSGFGELSSQGESY